ncbi:MAG: RNA 2',3'-cyclic phosphodiesterase [Candidatus Latescibacterota bacterium]
MSGDRDTMDIDTLRSFIAIELPKTLQDILNALFSDLRREDADVGWVPATNLHLTLKFLGDVERTRFPDLIHGIQQATKGTEPFDLTLTGLGAFPNVRTPKILWIGLGAPHALQRLQENIEEALFRLHFPRDERSFSPHLTIGRVKALRGIGPLISLIQERSFGPERFMVTRIALTQSTLRSTGAVHTPLEEFALAG